MIPYQQALGDKWKEKQKSGGGGSGRVDVCDKSLGWNSFSFSPLFVLSNQNNR